MILHNITIVNEDTLQYSIESEFELLSQNAFKINSILSFIESFVLVMIAQISDQSIISFILIQSATNTLTAFLSCTIASMTLMFIFFITGYGLTFCLPSSFITCMIIISLLFSSVCLIKKNKKGSCNYNSNTLENNYLIKKQLNKPRIDLLRQLSIIPETNKEDSNNDDKDRESTNVLLFDHIGNCRCIIDQKEEIDNIDLELVFETAGKLIVSDWLNQTYFYALMISMTFDLRSALPGVFCLILIQYTIGNYYWNAIKHFIPKQIDLLLAGLFRLWHSNIIIK